MPPSPDPKPNSPAIDDAGYARLAALREGIRRYLAWAEQQARVHGMTPAQVQLALAIRSHPDPAGPNLTRLSETLELRHNSVIGLVERAERAGLVTRSRDQQRHGQVRVHLTREGSDRLAAVSALHLEWLAEHAPELAPVWASFGPERPADRISRRT